MRIKIWSKRECQEWHLDFERMNNHHLKAVEKVTVLKNQVSVVAKIWEECLKKKLKIKGNVPYLERKGKGSGWRWRYNWELWHMASWEWAASGEWEEVGELSLWMNARLRIMADLISVFEKAGFWIQWPKDLAHSTLVNMNSFYSCNKF